MIIDHKESITFDFPRIIRNIIRKCSKRRNRFKSRSHRIQSLRRAVQARRSRIIEEVHDRLLRRFIGRRFQKNTVVIIRIVCHCKRFTCLSIEDYYRASLCVSEILDIIFCSLDILDFFF